MALLKSWGISSNDAYTIIRVLTSIGLLDGVVPNTNYKQYMSEGTPSQVLGVLIKSTYADLFQADHNPNKDDATVKLLFNVHGGTSAEGTLKPMRQTFSTLCEFADFGAAGSSPQPQREIPEIHLQSPAPRPHQVDQPSHPSIAINIQLTLPAGMDEDGYDKFFASMKKNLWPEK